MTCKESADIEAKMEGKSIVGRKHSGDENENTIYTFANLTFPIEITDIE